MCALLYWYEYLYRPADFCFSNKDNISDLLVKEPEKKTEDAILVYYKSFGWELPLSASLNKQ